jgi:hypothetical protein
MIYICLHTFDTLLPLLRIPTKCKSFTGYEGSYAFVDASTIDRCVAFWKRDGRTFVIDREWAIDDPEMDSTEY